MRGKMNCPHCDKNFYSFEKLKEHISELYTTRDKRKKITKEKYNEYNTCIEADQKRRIEYEAAERKRRIEYEAAETLRKAQPMQFTVGDYEEMKDMLSDLCDALNIIAREMGERNKCCRS